jgi:nitroreductase
MEECDMQASDEALKREMLERVIMERRTQRKFEPQYPSREEIKAVIRAGVHAPYSTIGARNRSEVRRFFVVKNGTATRQKMKDLAYTFALKAYGRLKHKAWRDILRIIDAVRSGGALPPQNMADVAAWYKGHVERGYYWGIGNAPYFVIIAERRRAPWFIGNLNVQSKAHALQNMWLEATALGLAFQPVSITAYLANDRAFCDLLRLEPHEYVMDGCAIGYPSERIGPTEEEDVNAGAVVTWLE